MNTGDPQLAHEPRTAISELVVLTNSDELTLSFGAADGIVQVRLEFGKRPHGMNALPECLRHSVQWQMVMSKGVRVLVKVIWPHRQLPRRVGVVESR